MKLNLEHFSIRSTEPLASWIEQQILVLGCLRQIDVANVRVARLANSSPAYEVRIHLVTPGPDVFAEGTDHTLRAALAKVMGQIRKTIVGRSVKRLRKFKSNLQARRIG